MSLWLGDGWIDVDEATKCVQAAALVSAPHEASKHGSGTKSKQNDTNKEETYAVCITTPNAFQPGFRTHIEGCDSDKGKPSKQLTIAADHWSVFQPLWHVHLEARHGVGNIDH